MSWLTNASDDVKQRHRERNLEYYRSNRERVLQRMKDRYHADPEFRAKSIARAKRHPSASRPRNRWGVYQQWKDEHPEWLRKRRLNWYQRRKAFERLAETGERIDYELIRLAANGICRICQQALDGREEFDHIVPLSKGGKHAMNNLQLVHSTCNKKKGTKLRVS